MLDNRRAISALVLISGLFIVILLANGNLLFLHNSTTHRHSRFLRGSYCSGQEEFLFASSPVKLLGLSLLGMTASFLSKRKAAPTNQYKFGFTSNVELESLPAGLNEEIVKRISALNCEPEWLLDFRLAAYCKLLKMDIPRFRIGKIGCHLLLL
jgi:hypothetical protein